MRQGKMRIVPLLLRGLDLGGILAAKVHLGDTTGGWDTRAALAAFM